MIRVVCPACNSKLDAKDHLEGQTRNCPKCGQAVRIQRSEPPAQDQPLAMPASERLVRLNRYLICDRTKVVATWENNGQGWMLRTESGFAPVFRHAQSIPGQGDFQLVELKMAEESDGLRLHGLATHQLSPHYALVNLTRGDDAILRSVTGPGRLNRDQKTAIRKYLGDHLMWEIWGNAHEVLDNLASVEG